MQNETFVCIDTSILFRVVSQGQPGCEWNHWESLKNFLDKQRLVLLLPEVIRLEFAKTTIDLEKKISANIVDIEKALDKHLDGQSKERKQWNEVEDVVSYLKESFLQWKALKTNGVKKRRHDLLECLNAESVRVLPFNQEIHFNAHRRIIAGKIPDPEKSYRASQDCYIIESLLSFFKNSSNSQLAFCTANLADFALDLPDGGKALHPTISDGFPPNSVFGNLKDLVSFLQDQKQLEDPPDEIVQEALELERGKRAIQEALDRAEQEALRQMIFEGNRSVPAQLREIQRYKELFNQSDFSAIGEQASELLRKAEAIKVVDAANKIAEIVGSSEIQQILKPGNQISDLLKDNSLLKAFEVVEKLRALYGEDHSSVSFNKVQAILEESGAIQALRDFDATIKRFNTDDSIK